LFEKTFAQKDSEAKTHLSQGIASSNLLSEIPEKASERYLFGVSVYCSAEALDLWQTRFTDSLEARSRMNSQNGE